MIDLEETGPCSGTKGCQNVGKRARGARDIEPMAARTDVFVKSYCCSDCLPVVALRALWPVKGRR